MPPSMRGIYNHASDYQTIRREQWRRSKARARAKKYRERQAGTTCRMTTGLHGMCLGRIVEYVDQLGRLQHYCERCERKRAGICQHCPQRVYGKRGWAQYCVDCKRRVCADQNRKWVCNNRERKNAGVRARRRRLRNAT